MSLWKRPTSVSTLSVASIALLAPALTGARGGGCESVNLQTPAPDMTGEWEVLYDDEFDVEIAIGGAVHTAQLGTQGGTIDITHEGKPLSFEVDCSREEVICPSEVWPSTVSAEHRNERFPHRVWMTLPSQQCSGATVAPAPEECGSGTQNPDCEDVCEGGVEVREVDRFGVINADGDGFEVLLGAGVASNGLNCLLLGTSLADADLETTGAADEDNWEATAMGDGKVQTAYSGGCLWAGDPNMDGELEALVLGASVKITTGFTAVKL